MGEQVRTGTVDLWVERRGQGPEVLIIAGLGDPVEAWQFQLEGLADRYRLAAYDNRGVGRTPMPQEPLTVAAVADDAAALLGALGVPAAHVVGQSTGGVIAQELVLRHPEVVRSLVLVSTWARLDAYFRSTLKLWRWLVEAAPSERAFLEAFADHETADRMAAIAAPTLVLAGGLDRPATPQFGRELAEGIPGARFHLLPEEGHRPFVEAPEEFNALLDAFWREVETSPRPEAGRGG